MHNIIYTDHLKLRLRIRKIPFYYPETVYRDADYKFFDNLEKSEIAIKKLKYKGKLTNMMIAYEIYGKKVRIMTIHPVNDEQILNRINNRRWTKK